MALVKLIATKSEILLNKKGSISALSGAKRFLFSSYMSPAVENSVSEGTDVGGAERNLIANSASGGKSVFCPPAVQICSMEGYQWLCEILVHHCIVCTVNLDANFFKDL